MAQFDTDQIGSVGTVVGAALETAGHYLQSDFIDLLSSGLGVSLGGLLYIFGIVSALTIFAIGGNYKFAYWLLLGPIIYYAVVFSRTESCGPLVKFGAKTINEQVVVSAVEGVVDEQSCQNSPAKVSIAFSLWNQVVSSTVDAFVSVLRLVQNKMDADFLVKVDRYMMVLNFNIDDPMIKEFINVTAVNNCSQYFALTQALSNPVIGAPQENILRQELEQLNGQIVVDLNQYPVMRDWALAAEIIEPKSDNQYRYSCEEVWKMGVIALKANGVELLAKLVGVQDYPHLSEEEQRAARLDIYNKLGEKFALSLDKSGQISSEPGSEDDNLLVLINEIAVRSFIRELGQTTPGLAKDAIDQLPFIGVDGRQRGSAQETAQAIRTRNAKEEFRGKGDFLKLVMGLPYLQGAILFFLAGLFPFFALVIILPGRHHALLLWMGLWFWIKSWDFGFAVVMLIDELLYKLMPHGLPVGNDVVNSPLEAMKRVLEVDPTYSAQTYYNIMATCMAAIPVLTGMMVKKSGGQVLDGIAQGFKNFGGDVGSSTSSYAGSILSQTLQSKVMSNIDSAVAKAMPGIKQGAALNAMMQKGVDSNLMGSAVSGMIQHPIRAGGAMIGGLLSVPGAYRATAPGGGGFMSRMGTAVNQVATKQSRGFLSGTGSSLGGFGFTTGPEEGLAKGMGSAFKGKYWGMGTAEIAYQAKKVAYEESLQYYNQDLAEKANLLGYYKHSWFMPHPGYTQFEVTRKEHELFWGDKLDDWGSSRWNQAVGIASLSGILAGAEKLINGRKP
jgi:hypothetical protein